jgi:hypothetical protein
MPLENEKNSEEDIQQALGQAQRLSDGAGEELLSSGRDLPPSDTMAQTSNCPLLGLRYSVSKCGLMAERYPWQTTAALLLVTGCGWLCSYFGLTLLAGLLLYAVYAEE